MIGKILIYMIVPSAIVYAFWVTWKYFNRSTPEENSKEDIENNSSTYL